MSCFYMKHNTGLKRVKVLPQEAWKYVTLIKFSNNNTSKMVEDLDILMVNSL